MAGAAAVDPARGKVIAEVRCTPCHHLDRTSKRIGPGLKGIYGRKPTITGVPFSHWDAAALDAWISNPRAIKPNTEMVRLPISARDRADLIAWFKADKAESESAAK
jgi:cytochrome c